MNEYMMTVTDDDFEEKVLKSQTPILVDFWAPWCGPCLSIAPTLEELAKEFKGRFLVAKMNVDENANTPVVYGVRSIPYMVVFKGGKIVDSIVGAVPKTKLMDMMAKSVG